MNVFFRSVPRYYKQGGRSNELVVSQSPGGKNVSTETEDIIRIRYQATTAVVTVIFGICNSVRLS
jgi:hypothetical protein